MLYSLFVLYANIVPRRSPAISIGVTIALYWSIRSDSKPSVKRLIFSCVDRIFKKRSFSKESVFAPISLVIK